MDTNRKTSRGPRSKTHPSDCQLTRSICHAFTGLIELRVPSTWWDYSDGKDVAKGLEALALLSEIPSPTSPMHHVLSPAIYIYIYYIYIYIYYIYIYIFGLKPTRSV